MFVFIYHHISYVCSVWLEGLTPNTSYVVSPEFIRPRRLGIVEGCVCSTPYRIRTLPRSSSAIAPLFSFADAGSVGGRTNRVAAVAQSLSKQIEMVDPFSSLPVYSAMIPSFLLLGGDVAYDHGNSFWKTPNHTRPLKPHPF